jgi:heme A synthase
VTSLRRLSYTTLGIAIAHLVFGAIVRITGSGMGCGDHWPKCYGHWFPPFDHPTLVIEWTHRLLAALLIAAVVTLTGVALAKRGTPQVGGRGGVLRAATLAAVVVVVTALFGAITVFLGNVWYATLVHWLLAAILLAALAAAVIRTGGLGGTSARLQRSTPRAARGAVAAAGVALIVVMLGGLTAKFPGASVACHGFPLCRGEIQANLIGARHVQLTHRILAFLLFFHVLGLWIGFTKRREAPVVLRTLRIAFGLIVLQVLVAAAMVEMKNPLLPPQLRSLHQAIGVGIWLALFTLAYLSRLSARRGEPAEVEVAEVADAVKVEAMPDIPGTATVRAEPAEPSAAVRAPVPLRSVPAMPAPEPMEAAPSALPVEAPRAEVAPPPPPPAPAPSVAVIIARGAES